MKPIIYPKAIHKKTNSKGKRNTRRKRRRTGRGIQPKSIRCKVAQTSQKEKSDKRKRAQRVERCSRPDDIDDAGSKCKKTNGKRKCSLVKHDTNPPRPEVDQNCRVSTRNCRPSSPNTPSHMLRPVFPSITPMTAAPRQRQDHRSSSSPSL
jgi:hypothetical protein